MSTIDPTPWLRAHEALIVRLRRAAGALLTLNFAIFWLVPIAVQGQAFTLALRHVLSPIYDLVDQALAIRRFAARWIYRREVHVDYFATALFFLLGLSLSLGAVFYWQLVHGSLSGWLIVLYYFAWVGFGGRGMGAAYTFAHREGHRPGGRLYQPWIRNTVGNFFENWIGFFFGNVPYNFSTSHNVLHHRLDAGKGDPFYLWDLDRTSFSDLMLYQWRIFVYMTGWSSMKAFRQQPDSRQATENYRLLLKGVLLYWVVVPSMIFSGLLLAGSTPLSALGFLFFIYLQPLCAMAFFLGFVNIGFHGFIEFDENGKHVECVASTTILDGNDDSFGEDDHMAHHYFTAVEHVDLPAHHESQRAEWANRQATVFKEMAVPELSVLILLGRFDELVEKHYVDYAGTLSPKELSKLLEERAKRKEMPYEDYEFRYLPSLRATADELVRRGTCRSVTAAYLYQSHHNVQFDLSVPTS
jgi:hypothetical protein